MTPFVFLTLLLAFLVCAVFIAIVSAPLEAKNQIRQMAIFAAAFWISAVVVELCK